MYPAAINNSFHLDAKSKYGHRIFEMNQMNKEKLQSLNLELPNLEGIIIVACSGGPDSICLLHNLKKIICYPEIICAHFDHKWNQSSSKATKIVEMLCKELSIPIVIGEAETIGQTSEALAREQRYNFLTQVAEDYSAKTIITAHHLDDQIETFFLRLFRGTGPSGLECIKKKRILDSNIQLLRPLLDTHKSDILNYCQTHQLFFYEDPSNKELDIKRNQIRNQLIPLIQRIQPNYKKLISNLIEITASQNHFINNKFEDIDEQAYDKQAIFEKQPIAFQRLILKSLFENYEISNNFDQLEELRKKIIFGENFKVSIAQDSFFELNNGEFKLNKVFPTENFSIPPIQFELDGSNEKEIEIPKVGKVLIKEERLSLSKINTSSNSYQVHVDFSRLNKGTKFILRGREQKDTFQQLNSQNTSKLKNFLINRKVKQNLKMPHSYEKLILLSMEDSKEGLWIPGVEISDKIKVHDFSTHYLEFIPSQIGAKEKNSALSTIPEIKE